MVLARDLEYLDFLLDPTLVDTALEPSDASHSQPIAVLKSILDPHAFKKNTKPGKRQARLLKLASKVVAVSDVSLDDLQESIPRHILPLLMRSVAAEFRTTHHQCLLWRWILRASIQSAEPMILPDEDTAGRDRATGPSATEILASDAMSDTGSVCSDMSTESGYSTDVDNILRAVGAVESAPISAGDSALGGVSEISIANLLEETLAQAATLELSLAFRCSSLIDLAQWYLCYPNIPKAGACLKKASEYACDISGTGMSRRDYFCREKLDSLLLTTQMCLGAMKNPIAGEASRLVRMEIARKTADGNLVVSILSEENSAICSGGKEGEVFGTLYRLNLERDQTLAEHRTQIQILNFISHLIWPSKLSPLSYPCCAWRDERLVETLVRASVPMSDQILYHQVLDKVRQAASAGQREIFTGESARSQEEGESLSGKKRVATEEPFSSLSTAHSTNVGALFCVSDSDSVEKILAGLGLAEDVSIRDAALVNAALRAIKIGEFSSASKCVEEISRINSSVSSDLLMAVINLNLNRHEEIEIKLFEKFPPNCLSLMLDLTATLINFNRWPEVSLLSQIFRNANFPKISNFLSAFAAAATASSTNEPLSLSAGDANFSVEIAIKCGSEILEALAPSENIQDSPTSLLTALVSPHPLKRCVIFSAGVLTALGAVKPFGLWVVRFGEILADMKTDERTAASVGGKDMNILIQSWLTIAKHLLSLNPEVVVSQAIGDALTEVGQYRDAIKHFLLPFSLTQNLRNNHATPLDSILPQPTAKNLAMALSSVGAHCEALLVSQCVSKIDYEFAFAICQDHYGNLTEAHLALLFDTSILENLIYIFESNRDVARTDRLLKQIGLAELNAHNPINISAAVTSRFAMNIYKYLSANFI